MKGIKGKDFPSFLFFLSILFILLSRPIPPLPLPTMTITAYEITRFDVMVSVTVTSDLLGTGLVYYHWYLDGLYQGVTTSPTRAFVLDGEQARVEVVDTLDANFDPYADPPDAYPARRTVWWVRSLDADTDHYRVEQKEGAGEWAAIGAVAHDASKWSYELVTDRLTDLTDYKWRVIPVSQAGNDGGPIELAVERVVRTPDAPGFTIAYDADTDEVTFAEA